MKIQFLIFYVCMIWELLAMEGQAALAFNAGLIAEIYEEEVTEKDPHQKLYILLKKLQETHLPEEKIDFPYIEWRPVDQPGIHQRLITDNEKILSKKRKIEHDAHNQERYHCNLRDNVTGIECMALCSKKALKIHKQVAIHKTQRCLDSTCQKVFFSWLAKAQHVEEQHPHLLTEEKKDKKVKLRPKAILKCEKCGYITRYQSSLDAHMLCPHDLHLVCGKCGSVFISRAARKQHSRKTGHNVAQCYCDLQDEKTGIICNAICQDQKGLKNHKDAQHKIVLCPHPSCEKLLFSQLARKQHKRDHSSMPIKK